ncbi:MAG: TonB family protein [Bdellovibrionales bacterium]
MNALRESPYIDTFPKLVATSLGLHALVIALFVVRAAWVPSDELLIRNSIRVDMVALPDKVATPAPAEAPAKPEPVPVAKTEPVKPSPVAPKKVEKVHDKKAELKKLQETQKKALEQLKAQSAIERMKNEIEENSKPKPKPPSFKGNAVNQGDGLTGLEKIEFDRYFGDLEKKIKQHWNLPGWLVEAKLRAQAMVLIDNSGAVVKRQILTSSGNDVFDGQVLAAIDGAAPFPEPPARLKDVLALRGIVFNFPD